MEEHPSAYEEIIAAVNLAFPPRPGRDGNALYDLVLELAAFKELAIKSRFS